MKKTVLIIHPSKFDPTRFEKYELENFKKKGYNIIVHDLTKLYFPKVNVVNLTHINNYKDEVVSIKSLKDWTDHLKSIEKNYDFILILNFTLEYVEFRNINIFKTLGKNLAYSKTINIYFSNPGVLNPYYNLRNLWFESLKIFKHVVFQNFLNIYKEILLVLAGSKIDFILLGGVSDKNKFLYKSKKNMILGHSWDMSNLINSSSRYSISDKHILLIDGAGPKFKNDDLYLNKESEITSEKWYPKLCEFFNFIEKNSEKVVKIKAHYSAKHEKNPIYFGKRDVLNSNLVQLITDSCFIISRYSTALFYGLIFDKPIIIITSNEVRKNFPARYIQQKKLSEYLKCKMINIDDSKQYSQALTSMLTKSDIKKKFIKTFCSFDMNSKPNSIKIIDFIS